MAVLFLGRGNLGALPELKWVTVDGEQRAVCELRIFFDRRVPDGDGGFVDRGGFWRDVSYWGKRAEAMACLLVKGARVAVQGVEMEERWTDKASGEERSKAVVAADFIDIDPISVETVVFKSRSAETATA
jgi:single-strand DNA-binding protein